MLVVDTSGSMEALDLDPHERSLSRRRNRLQVAKEVVEEFIEGRDSDQIGLVVFGTEGATDPDTYAEIVGRTTEGLTQ